LNVVLVFPSDPSKRQALARAIKKSGKIQVAFEGTCLVCKTGDPSRTASGLADLSGIGSVAVAKSVSSRFYDVVNAIVQAGSKAILPGERFYVQVIQTAEADYVDRDIEFASAGVLVGKLAKITAIPAKSEHEADRVILAVVGKRSAYVCFKGRI
jgi:hypothetical protein